MDLKAKWIIPGREMGDTSPVYRVGFAADTVKSAVLRITALGVYEARINGTRVGDFFMAPGFTSYRKRLQVQEYDVTRLLSDENELTVTVGKGWYHSRFLALWEVPQWRADMMASPMALIAQLDIEYADGRRSVIGTDGSWEWSESRVRFSDLYDGEIYDAGFEHSWQPVEIYDGPDEILIPQQGEEVRPQERLAVKSVIHTPKGETVLDFGQNMAGVIAVSLCAHAGDTVELSFGETLDAEGNFYNANYRSAKCIYKYICREGEQSWEPRHTFYGFRYVRVDAFPGGAGALDPGCFTAVVMHSDMKRTGWLESSDPLLNRFFENVLWGQKSNFLDIPTDCPQRDERAGWTGDAQVFARTACLNYDAERFFTKWLADLRSDQRANGLVPSVVPDVRDRLYSSPAWGDAAAIVPWQVYLAYGNRQLLADSFDSMRRWVDYITSVTKVPGLWRDELPEGKRHYGDWLGLDAPYGSYKGSSRDDFIGTAFYAHDTSLLVKTGQILGRDVTDYEKLHGEIIDAFQKAFPVYNTQTECVLAAHFKVAPDPDAAAAQLARMVLDAGAAMTPDTGQAYPAAALTTGFVGTPYLLHVLSDYGFDELAWSLLLRREYPSWLYSVTQGATTVWEHWDGMKPDGQMWSTDMNSFNHYAYGSVADWVYTKAAGIQTVEDHPGYERVRIAPVPDERLGSLSARLLTRRGEIVSSWRSDGEGFAFEITTPVQAEIVIDGEKYAAGPGTHRFSCGSKRI